jgi:hypothetical protein
VVVVLRKILFPKKRTEPVTIPRIPEEQIERQDIFRRVFVEGTTVTQGDTTFSFYRQEIGQVKIPTGKLVACDALFLMDKGIPFTRMVPAGEYPVELAIARIETDERIAFARIRFSDRTAVKWEMAALPGQDIRTLKKDQIFGYPVDSGTGSFMDQRGYEELLKRSEKDGYFTFVISEMRKEYKPTRDWTIMDYGDSNVAFFSSGAGDGMYASFWGLDEQGNVVDITTDFNLVEWKS